MWLAFVVGSFVVLALAASSPPVRVWTESEPPTDTAAPSRPAARETRDISLPEPPGGGAEYGEGLVGVAIVLGALAVAGIVYTIVMTKRRWRPRSPWARATARVEPPPSIAPVDVELDVDAQLAAIEAGSPRNAIVACWLQMEEDVANAGLPRRPAETSTEYTTRVLGASAIDPAPVQALSALYREARFSRHELDDEHRRRAATSLRAIHAALDEGRGALARGARP